jgi:hypothetical protein
LRALDVFVPLSVLRTIICLVLVAPAPGTATAPPAGETPGRGARVPFIEHEAEAAITNGPLIGPDRTFTTLAAEASGRRAVLLDRPGRFVEFTLRAPANALTVRGAIPDGADGRGIDATLGVVVEGEHIATLAMSSRYGWFYGDYPFSNRPADGKPHHFFDETRVMLGRTLPAGARVRLAVGAGDTAPWYAIDLADFELVPSPAMPPAGAISIVDFGGDARGKTDSYPAMVAAITAARRRGVPVWIPPGTFRIDRHVTVDRVAIVGAGPWHSVLRGDGIGLYGRKAPRGSRAVTLRDFALIGEVKERVDTDQLAGIGGAIGGGSEISNLWIQHHKVGIWLDGPATGIAVRGVRIVDQTADGLNFRRGISDAVVEDSFVRNSGDDGLAAWSHHESNRNIVFRNNTVVAPILANGIAIYGGRDITITGNLVADSVTQGGGIHVGNRFSAAPLAGEIRIDDNRIVRGGSFDPNWRFGVGALWVYALDAPIAAQLRLRRLALIDSTLPAIHFIGKPIAEATLEDITIDGAGGSAFQLQSGGRAILSDVVANGLSGPGVLSCGASFELVDRGGNRGIEGRSGDCVPFEP